MEARKTKIVMADCIKSDLERVGEVLKKMIEKLETAAQNIVRDK